MCQENVVLCAASAYDEKFYFNQDFDALPESIKEELKIICAFYGRCGRRPNDRIYPGGRFGTSGGCG